MNEAPKKDSKPKAMEGRAHDASGKDIGDARFHEVGWNTTPEAARADVERIAVTEAELAEQQAEAFANKSKDLGIKAYEGLLAIYPNHPLRERWIKRLEELKRT